ncbi:MAG: ATP-binding protein [Solirubrobacteraceae bacterium]|jgi:signal transduction histidine kinase/phage shock protein PspC (stress-responsive transcriptional regulator)
MERALSTRALGGAAFTLAGGGAALAALGGVAVPTDLGDAALAVVSGAIAIASSPASLGDRQQDGWYAGVAGALARPWLPAWAIRVAVLLTAPIAGLGVAAYCAAAFVLALTKPAGAPPRIDALRVVGTGFVGLAVVLAARAAGLLVGGTEIPWAIMLVGAGLAAFWSAAGLLRGADADGKLGADRATRTLLGLVLAFAGAAWVLSRAGTFHPLGKTIVGVIVALAVLALVVGPRWLRTSRALAAERTGRARAQERAALADHLHDSVLQTLALIQRRAGDPAAVSQIARRQERELRQWLLDGPASDEDESLDGALRGTVAEIEDSYGVRVELVSVGDAPLDDRARALLGATREALSNAARHAPDAPISLFAKVTAEEIEVFVHDRGPGFEVEAIPAERRGVRESIIARMERHGGVAVVASAPGKGCEITLRMARR